MSSPSHSPPRPIPDVILKKDLSFWEIWRRPLPLVPLPLTNLLSRLLASTLGRRVISIEGLQQLAPDQDPFILVANHSQRLEALSIPGILAFHRQGRVIHFVADWNFWLVPGVGLFYHAGQVITIARKPAKPKFLNVFKPLFTDGVPGLTRMRAKLEEGASVGIFPEGTANRDPRHLLRGFSGAAQLSLATATPVVPMGIRFPRHTNGSRIPAFASMTVQIGTPLHPPPAGKESRLSQIRHWHGEIMMAISRLSGKAWQPQSRKR